MNSRTLVRIREFAIIGAVLVAAVALAIWGWNQWSGKSSSTRFDSTKPNGASIAMDPADAMRVNAESYDIGRTDGLEAKGLRVLSYEELRGLADEGIRRYSRYVGDPRYRDAQEAQERQQYEGQGGQQGADQQQPSAVAQPSARQAAPATRQPSAQQRPAGAAKPQGPAAAPATQRPAAQPKATQQPPTAQQKK